MARFKKGDIVIFIPTGETCVITDIKIIIYGLEYIMRGTSNLTFIGYEDDIEEYKAPLVPSRYALDSLVYGSRGAGTVWGGYTENDIKWVPPKCECGADKTYGPSNEHHSYWCPLAKKENGNGR